MTEYIYKRFKVYYEIVPFAENTEYRAKAYVINYMDKNGPSLTEKFQTSSPCHDEAQREIKKLIERYIDFEYQQYH